MSRSCTRFCERSDSSRARALPALLAYDLVEGATTAGAIRSGEDRGICWIAERQDEGAVLVGRKTKEASSHLVVVDGGRGAADPEIPRREHHVLRRSPQVPHDRLPARAIGIRRDQGD